MYLGMNPDTGSLAKSLLDRLQSALLSLLATLENYSVAFEALGGMRGMTSPFRYSPVAYCRLLTTWITDQVRDKVYSSVAFDGAALSC